METKNHISVKHGERDIGIFLFRCKPVLSNLSLYIKKNNSPNAEHSFLEIIEKLIHKNYTVQGYDISTENDLLSLNKISDIK